MHIFQSKFLFFLFGYVSIAAFENCEKEKRLLLNDPDVFLTQLYYETNVRNFIVVSM
jgi:hypothetical protein